MSNDQVTIQRFDFTKTLLDTFVNNPYARDLWPIVYLLSDGKKKRAYVGETADALSRLTTHLANSEKSKLSAAHLHPHSQHTRWASW